MRGVEDNDQDLAPDQRLTCGDVRPAIQEDHRLNLLRWLEESLKADYSLEQISIQLAL
jgi:hypothetical protein